MIAVAHYLPDYGQQLSNTNDIAVGASSGKEVPIMASPARSKPNIPQAIGMGASILGALYAAISLLGGKMMSRGPAIFMLILGIVFFVFLSSIPDGNANSSRKKDR